MAGIAAAAVAAALLSCPAAPAAAQPFAPTRSTERDLRSLHNFARCLAFHHPAVALAFVSTAPGQRGYRRVRYQVREAGADCAIVDTPQWAAEYVLRGAVAEALYLKDHEALPADAAASTGSAQPASLDLEGLAACVAARNPERVDALLRTVWGSAEEAAAMAALEGDFAGCASGAAVHPSITMLMVRAAIDSGHFLRVRALAGGGRR